MKMELIFIINYSKARYATADWWSPLSTADYLSGGPETSKNTFHLYVCWQQPGYSPVQKWSVRLNSACAEESHFPHFLKFSNFDSEIIQNSR